MAREQTRRVVFTFHTTTQAIKMEQSARDQGKPGRLIPVPRQISSGCGMAWSAPAENRRELEALVQELEIEIEEIRELYL